MEDLKKVSFIFFDSYKGKKENNRLSEWRFSLTGDVPSLFDKLSLKYWYKYLLYVSGILFVLSVIVGSKIDLGRVLGFSLWTMGISIFLWILDDVFDIGDSYYTHKDNEGAKIGIAWGRQIIHFIFFFIWVIIVGNTLF